VKLILGPCVIDESTLEIASYVSTLFNRYADRFECYFKASWDKANRSSGGSYRGPGLEKGLKVLKAVKKRYGMMLTTDVHETGQVGVVASVVDMLQVPALLCRQTDLLVACGRAGRRVSVKKGQFMAPWDMVHVYNKVRSGGCKAEDICIIERGTSFGYNRLVVDMTSFAVMKGLGLETVFDVTHSLQTPCTGDGCSGGSTEYLVPLARAALGAGADGLFMEVCVDRAKAKCDGPNSVQTDDLAGVLESIFQN
jgi:2-dehydro-3-deoxyphosphooctonate aldolase (KDO 8-P synthase)